VTSQKVNSVMGTIVLLCFCMYQQTGDMYSLALSYTYTVHDAPLSWVHACASNIYDTQSTYPIQRIQFETQHTSEMLPDGEETIIHQSLQ